VIAPDFWPCPLEVLVGVSSWRFKSSSPHKKKGPFVGAFFFRKQQLTEHFSGSGMERLLHDSDRVIICVINETEMEAEMRYH
jgi:hypothetical protein